MIASDDDDEGGQSASLYLLHQLECAHLNQNALMLMLMINVMLRMEMLSTWLHTLKVRSRSHRASGRLSNVLNVETSDTFRF